VAWGEATGERILVAPVATEREIESALKIEFAAAIECNAEPEIFREIVCRHGFEDWIIGRDRTLAENEIKRRENVARARARHPDYVNWIVELFASGKSDDEVRRLTGLAKGTISAYKRLAYIRNMRRPYASRTWTLRDEPDSQSE
jgi:hypothetical protein